MAFCHHDRRVLVNRGGDRFGVARILCEHQARGDGTQNMFELVVVLADQGIGWRYGGVGYARDQAAEREQGVFQAVFAQDRNRFFGVQSLVDQPLGNAAGGGPGLGVINMFPEPQMTIGRLNAAGHEGVIGFDLRPVLQAVGQALGIGVQILLGAQVVSTRRTITKRYTGDAKLEGAESRRGHALFHPFLFSRVV